LRGGRRDQPRCAEDRHHRSGAGVEAELAAWLPARVGAVRARHPGRLPACPRPPGAARSSASVGDRPTRLTRPGAARIVAPMPGTFRLYYDDPLCLHFEGRVVAHALWQGRPSVILERTAFYPESGGQMADRGILAGRAVLDVQVDDDGVVHHVLEGE